MPAFSALQTAKSPIHTSKYENMQVHPSFTCLTCLQSLDICHPGHPIDPDSLPVLQTILQSLSTLQDLSISVTKVTNAEPLMYRRPAQKRPRPGSATALEEALASATALTSLSISVHDFAGMHLETPLELPRLCHLAVSSCNPETAARILSHLNAPLTSLALSGSSPTGGQAGLKGSKSRFLRALSEFTGLQRMHVTGARYAQGWPGKLLEAAAAPDSPAEQVMAQLQHLELSLASSGDVLLRRVVQALAAAMTSLKSLRFTACDKTATLTAADWPTMCVELAKLPLRDLSVRGLECMSRAGRNLFGGTKSAMPPWPDLQKLTSVTSLKLCGMPIPSALQDAEQLAQMASLRCLHLGQASRVFVRSLAQLARLTELVVDGAGVCDALKAFCREHGALQGVWPEMRRLAVGYGTRTPLSTVQVPHLLLFRPFAAATLP